jgi:plasmid stabilization system protein ParE
VRLRQGDEAALRKLDDGIEIVRILHDRMLPAKHL